MAFSLGSLSTWSKPATELLAKAVATPLTSKYVTILPGIKGSQYINTNASTILFQAGACSFNAINTTTVSQVLLTVDQVSSHETLCVSDFNAKSLSTMLSPGTSDNDDLAFVNMFMDEKMASTGAELAKMYWQGNKATGSNNLALTDGILCKLLHTSQSASTAFAVTTAVTVSNVIDTVDYCVNNIPAAVITKELVIYMTTTNFRLYIQALKNAGSFFYTGNFENFETKVPGYNNISVVGLPELDGNADGVDMVITHKGNFYWGCDLMSENEVADLFYDRASRSIKYALETKIGAAVAFPEFVGLVK